MKVIVEYIVSRAQWKIIAIENGTAMALPRRRYYDSQEEVREAFNELYVDEYIEVERRDICQEQQHGLSLAKVLASSNDGNRVFLQCHCGRKRIVKKGAMEKAS